jgi:hypothetical protein
MRCAQVTHPVVLPPGRMTWDGTRMVQRLVIGKTTMHTAGLSHTRIDQAYSDAKANTTAGVQHTSGPTTVELSRHTLCCLTTGSSQH